MNESNRGMRIVVIGNGPAGNWAASKAVALDPMCHVVLISEEHEAEYSPCALPYYISGKLEREKLFLKSFDDYRREGIDFRPDVRIEGVDYTSHQVYAGRLKFDYDRLVLATGTDAIIPPVEGAKIAGCFSAKTIRDADAIVSWKPRVVVVVGGGPVGLEVAGLLLEAGCQVSLYEVLPSVAQAVLDEPISGMVAEHLRQKGINLHLSEKVNRVLGRNGRVTGIEAESGILDCDTVIWATGVRARTEVAESVGLKKGSNGGIMVDEEMKTSRPEILACGDCVESIDRFTGRQGPIMLWGSAVLQGTIAGTNAVGQHVSYMGSSRIMSMNFLGLKTCSAGLTRETASHLPDLTFQQIAWRGATYSLLMSEGRAVGVQAIGREIDPAPFQTFFSMGLNARNAEEAAREWNPAGDTPWRMPYSNLKTFYDSLRCFKENGRVLPQL